MSSDRPHPTDPYPAGPDYPGGEDAPAYRWAFQVWLVLTLAVVCVSLTNYIASRVFS